MPGVRAILHRENIGRIFRSTQGPAFAGICEERRPPLEDDVVRYYGQYIALAVADTFEAAKAAADAVRVTYDKDEPNVETELEQSARNLVQQADAVAAMHLNDRVMLGGVGIDDHVRATGLGAKLVHPELFR